MKIIQYILISLTLLWMTVGCGSGNQTAQSGSNDGEIQLKSSSEIETMPSNWYIKLIVEDTARSMRSDSSQLGTLEVSDAVEGHTLKAVSPFGSSYLSIVFIDPDGVEPGTYKTNYHTYKEDLEDRWRFTVKTDDPNAQISFTWHGLYVLTPYVDDQDRTRYKEYRSLSNPLNKQMKFIDTVNGQEIAVVVDGKIQTYSFNMDGQTERTFEWIVQNEEISLPVQTSKFSTPQAKVSKIDVQTVQKNTRSFDLSKPPMIDQELHP